MRRLYQINYQSLDLVLLVRIDEDKFKLMENIKEFVKTLPIIHDFGDWLEKIGDKRRRK